MENWNPLCPGQKPHFRLEQYKRPVCKREPNIFFTKGEYQPGIKISDWERRVESRPIDHDPYCPGSLNLMQSHYNRLGSDDQPWSTTTASAMEQIKFKDEMNKVNYNNSKYMVNYLTYKDTLACEMDLIDRTCPPLCAESYMTTMQKSYRPPYPYAMQRFSFPTFPFIQNRKFQWTQDPLRSKYKFFDDSYAQEVEHIQKIKGFRTKSYDPSIYMNTDGSLPPERVQKCVKLEY